MSQPWRFHSYGAVAGVISLISGVAHAADAPAQPGALRNEASATQVEDVVVTAQRRTESAEKVPIAISTVSAEKIEAFSVGSLHQLGALVPGLTFDRSSSGIIPSLRGIGTTTVLAGDEPVTAVYIDGVYILASQANAFDLASVERIEVDKGPQGTLFGRNALGGVIQIITKTPSATPSFKASVGYGNYDTVRGDFYGTTGLADGVAVDLTLHARRQNEGWGKNLTTGVDTFRAYDIAAASKIVWDLDEATRITGAVSYSRDRSQLGIATRLLPGALGRDGVTRGPAGFWDINSNLNPYVDVMTAIGSLKFSHDLGWASLVNLAAYQKTVDHQVFDADASPSNLHSQTHVHLFTRAFTNELQLLSPAGSKVSWIVGAFYMHSEAGYNPANLSGAVFPPPYLDVINRQKTDSYSIFGQTTIPLSERLRLTVGGRWTKDYRDQKGAFFTSTGVPVGGLKVSSASWSSPSARVSVDYDLLPNLMGYVAYNRGFKSGVYNLVGPGDAPVKPTTIDAYEVGLKGHALDRRLRYDAAAFYYQLDDIQLRAASSTSNLAKTINAAKADVYGLDLSVDAVVTNRLTMHAAAEFLNTRYQSFPRAIISVPLATGGNGQIIGSAKGARLPHAPAFSGSVSANYRLPTDMGPFDWNVLYNYTTKTVWDPDNRLKNPAHGLLSASVKWAPGDGGWDVQLWGSNLTNEKYYLFMGAATDNAAGDSGSPAPPRTFGVTFTVRR